MQHQRLLTLFEQRRPAYAALAAEIEDAFTALVSDLDVEVHAITSRVKTHASLAGKLGRPDRTYRSLDALTDLVGVRVITYFEDTIRDIAERLERTFTVDLARSVDKRRQGELDRFGYRSLHYICKPPEDFFERHGFTPDPGLRFEVQLRTILQHAWAEMEHDLGYKATQAIPARIRRRFSRLAGLLELADEEFSAIKRHLHDYEHSVTATLDEASTDLPIDRISLIAFLDDKRVEAADATLARVIGHPHSDEAFYPDYLVEMFGLIGIEYLFELEAAVHDTTPLLEAFIPCYFEFARSAWDLSPETIGPVKRGYSLLFVAHILLLRSSTLDVERVEEISRFFLTLDHLDDRDTARTLAAMLIEASRCLETPP